MTSALTSKRSLAGIAVVLFSLFALRIALIRGQGTYPGHVDELFIANEALRILQTGDPNPGWFRYGSLPIYLTSLGMGMGVQAARMAGSLEHAGDVTSVQSPYYSHPEVMLVPRALFALFSIAGLLGAGLLGHALLRRRSAFVLSIAALSCSALYLRHSWKYLNVDIIATSMSLLALAYLVRTADEQTLRHRVVMPALFCGAVVASKYNSGLLGVPFLVAALQVPSRRFTNAVLLLALSLLAFFAFQPFALLDHSRFIEDVLSEMRHYRKGHAGYEAEPGLVQLAFYTTALGRDFGWPLCLFALLGIRRSLQISRRATLLVLAFPVLMLLHMITQRVHFTRTVLPAFSVLAVFMGLGLAAGWELVRRAARSSPRTRLAPWPAAAFAIPGRRGLAAVMGFAVLAALALGPGLRALAQAALSPVSDSRVAVGRWLHEHARGRCEIMVPKQLIIDDRDLDRCTVSRVDLDSASATERARVTAQSPAARERYVLHADFRGKTSGEKRRVAAWRVLIEQARLAAEFGSKSARLGVNVRKRSRQNPRLGLHRLPHP